MWGMPKTKSRVQWNMIQKEDEKHGKNIESRYFAIFLFKKTRRVFFCKSREIEWLPWLSQCSRLQIWWMWFSFIHYRSSKTKMIPKIFLYFFFILTAKVGVMIWQNLELFWHFIVYVNKYIYTYTIK